MAISVSPLILPPREYSEKDETQFRRDLQAQIASILSELKSINPGSSPQGSLSSKRETMLSVPIGIKEYS